MQSHDGVILVQFVNQDIPRDFLKFMSDKYKSSGGMAFMHSEHGLAIGSDVGHINLDQIDGILTKNRNRLIVMHLGTREKDKPFAKEDVQPFSLLKDGSKDLMIGVMRGDFSDHIGAPDVLGDHSLEYHIAVDYLAPKFKKIYEECGKDIGKLMKNLELPLTKRELMGGVEHGILTLLNYKGEILSFYPWGKTDSNKKEYVWGWASDTLGFDFAKAVHPKEEAPAKKGGFDDLMLGGPPAKKETSKSDKPVVDKVKEATPAPDEMVWWAPTLNVQGKQKLREAYEQVLGKAPAEYKKRPQVQVPKAKLVRLGLLNAEVADAIKSGDTATRGVAPTEEAVVSVETSISEVAEKTASVPSAGGKSGTAKAETEQSIEARFFPRIPEDDKEKVEAWVKSLDVAAYNIDLNNIEKLEKSHTMFSEDAGVPLETLLMLPDTDFVRLGYESPDSLAVFTSELRVRLIGQLARNKSLREAANNANLREARKADKPMAM